VAVVHGIDLVVHPGEVVALLGANGAGKTTTLCTVSGLLVPLGGAVVIDGEEQPRRRRPSARRISALARSGVAHVPEDRALFPTLTVRQHLTLGEGAARGAARAGDDAADAALEWLPELEPLLDRPAGELSGGQQQMVALARALVARPRLLMVDELSLGLAPVVVERLLPVVRQVARGTGAGVLLVEQHVRLALEVCDRAYLLRRGRVVAEGAAQDLAERPDLLRAGYLGGPEPGTPEQPDS
jgi:branched-chain amino acid transport system ATP-binding protein